jgi:hypothetical protein
MLDSLPKSILCVGGPHDGKWEQWPTDRPSSQDAGTSESHDHGYYLLTQVRGALWIAKHIYREPKEPAYFMEHPRYGMAPRSEN